jgi:hypothetical protein
MDNRPTGRQLVAARVLLGQSQPELSQLAKISPPTLKRMEASVGAAVGMANNVGAVVAALEAAGIEFLNHGHPGVRVKAQSLGLAPEQLNASIND